MRARKTIRAAGTLLLAAGVLTLVWLGAKLVGVTPRGGASYTPTERLAAGVTLPGN